MMKLFVGNLPYGATEADLENFFKRAGVTVDGVNVMRERFTGQARGFGFVVINNDANASLAIQTCDGRELIGKLIVVSEARPIPPRRSAGRPLVAG